MDVRGPASCFRGRRVYFLSMSDPVTCAYAPPGEYIKDHTLLLHDGWWHLFSISGTRGYYHGYNGNEETFSWSISRDLVNWEFRGHVMHPSQRPGLYDQHEVWAPHCLKANGRFYMFYTGVVHPQRPMEYQRLGFRHPWVFQGHRETQGLAISEDLTDWVKVDDPQNGIAVPGRDSHVVRDEPNNRWLLYSTGQGSQGMDDAYVSQSSDLVHWECLGVCARFPKLDPNRPLGFTVDSWQGFKAWGITTESLLVMRQPRSGKWIMLGNWQYAVSDDPTDFTHSPVSYYDTGHQAIDMGFACEIVSMNGNWYRSGTFGQIDHWQLGFTQIDWQPQGAFTIKQRSILAQ
jgi:Glycosyl hydrolases family 32 N-terminal domain